MSDFELVVRDGRGRPRIAVEVKRTRGRDAAWARAWRERRDDFATEPAVATMLVTLDRAFIWPASQRGPAPLEFEIVEELRPYFERTKIAPDDIGVEAFLVLARWWLDDLVSGFVEASAVLPFVIEALAVAPPITRETASVEFEHAS